MDVKLSLAMQQDGQGNVTDLGADCVIDAAGVSATLKIAMDLVRPNGQITKVGWGPQPLGFSIDPLVQKNVTLAGKFQSQLADMGTSHRLAGQWTTGRETHHRRRMANHGMA